MNAYERDERVKNIFNHCLAILTAKGHDYSGNEDCLRNFKRFGSKGILVRMYDKMERLITLSESKANVRESVEDTAKDLINYAALYLMVKSTEAGPVGLTGPQGVGRSTAPLGPMQDQVRVGTEDYQGDLICEKHKTPL
jgi:hypothetical protein